MGTMLFNTGQSKLIVVTIVQMDCLVHNTLLFLRYKKAYIVKTLEEIGVFIL